MLRAALAVVAAGLLAASGAAAPVPTTTYGAAGAQALSTLLDVYYAGNGLWNQCEQSACGATDSDWGADSLTYALALRARTAGDTSIPSVLAALTLAAPTYPAACRLPSCDSWSDVPEWDSIAASREYEVTHDPAALTKAEAAFGFVEGSDAFSLGACPDIRYQQPSGSINQLKTLESDGNAVKAAILLFQATGDQKYLTSAVTRYAAIRAHFLDPAVPLYTVYVFDNGQTCTQVPHRFFASVNGDMIWSGLELSKLTGTASYLDEAVASAKAVVADLSDPAGVFADLQAENDVVEPLVEGMYALATDGKQAFARSWILTNAAAAVSARAPDGAFGRFFDGPAPQTIVTAWQTNGGLALEIAAAALDPRGVIRIVNPWVGARRVARQLGPTGTLRFTGSEIALIGTLGESCCEAGHARVSVDGRETFDGTGIWQDKSSSGRAIKGTVLFAWRWPRPGRHTISFAPGVANGKEGGSFLHVRAYLVG
ncbi:MAG TPA: hypothetical protein VG265_11060 [Gaiellaceae bacterium]|nr:hypothetical protein [Gaiellaceae bacterium]